MAAHRIVRIVRDDGSVTFRGDRMSARRAEREASVWREEFPTWIVTIHLYDEVKSEVYAWQRAVGGVLGGRYYPPVVG